MKIRSEYVDILRALNDAGVEFIVVGAYAVAFYAEPRFTKDLDIWVRPSRDNARRVLRALAMFGAPIDKLTTDDLCDKRTIFQIGVEPVRVDILAGVGGLTFERSVKLAERTSFDGVPILVLGRGDLIDAKARANRAVDRRDVLTLKRSAARAKRPRRKARTTRHL